MAGRVGSDGLVVVALPRSIGLIVTIIAVLRVRGAYVPVDPSYPDARIGTMLDDSGAALVVTAAEFGPRIKGLLPPHAELMLVDELPPPPQEHGVTRYPHPDELAYLIFTSGTTGRPKGVAVTHAGLANLIAGQRSRLAVGGEACTAEVVDRGHHRGRIRQRHADRLRHARRPRGAAAAA
ncbi:AMP-binding protein [Nocardia sp. GAS34]|uniref:AMP-binding protein n=1 Tax=unclassified Nocardia TaxID=2637762 RepID=UPI003D211BC3